MRRESRRTTPARGIATLTVVMVLFFILAMVAAYTNRTLIIDQRSSANNLRGAQAMEAAEAGVEWALTQLNGPRASAVCASSDQSADDEFRSRYLTRNPDDSWVVQNYQVNGVNYGYAPSCVADAGTWTCSCPTAGSPTPTLNPTSDGLGQAFRVTFQALQGANYPARAGSIGILSQGCSNLGGSGSGCISQQQVPQVDAVAQVVTAAGLVRALPFVPAAALTAGTTINAAMLQVANPDAATGLTVHAGGTITMTSPQLAGPAGSGSDGQVANDSALAARAATGGRFFESLFGMDVTNYQRQPAVTTINCSAGCTSTDLADTLARFPGRMIWVAGNLTLDAPATIGSVARPVMIVATGTVTFTAAVNYYGLLYANAITWSGGASAAVVTGALVSATTFTATATATVVYDATLLATIGRSYGSFVRIPGGTQYF